MCYKAITAICQAHCHFLVLTDISPHEVGWIINPQLNWMFCYQSKRFSCGTNYYIFREVDIITYPWPKLNVIFPSGFVVLTMAIQFIIVLLAYGLVLPLTDDFTSVLLGRLKGIWWVYGNINLYSPSATKNWGTSASEWSSYHMHVNYKLI